MTDSHLDTVIRRAIGGDPAAIESILGAGESTRSPLVLTMVAMLTARQVVLDRALRFAGTSRERQVVAIARAHLDGDSELVDALARDHLVDHPDSLIVAWIASDPAR